MLFVDTNGVEFMTVEIDYAVLFIYRCIESLQNEIKWTIVLATERSQLSPIEISMNALDSEDDSAVFFQWHQL